MKTIIGSIIERPRKDGGISYQAMVRIPKAKAAVGTFQDRAGAEAFLESFQANRKKSTTTQSSSDRNRWITALSPGQQADINQEKWANEWLDATLKLYSECEGVSGRLKHSINTIRKLSGDVKLGELDKKWVREFIKRARAMETNRKLPFKWATIVDHLRTVSSAIKWHAEELEAKGARLPFNADMVPKNWQIKRTRRLSLDEERQLQARFRINAKRSRPHWIRMLRMALHTAARLQEIVLAEWSEFDLKRCFWTIPAEHTKAGKERVVPLGKSIIRSLKVMKLIANPESPRVFHEIKSTRSASSVFSRMTRSMGIVDLRFHDLRHEAISRMVLKQRELSVFEIMDIVGHSDLKMLKRYANLRGDELAAKWIE